MVLLARFPTQADDLNAKRTASLATIEDGQSLQRGVEWGQFVAEAILDWRSTDGFTPAPAPYFGGDEPGQWRPTPPLFGPGAAPQFATMTPWGIDSPDQFRPAGPPALDSDQYLDELQETKEMGSDDSTLRTADETAACRFWADTSGTHAWNLVAIDLSADQGFDLSENARLLATLNLAIADALISCWDAKYHFEFWRPVTAIRLEDADGDGNPDNPDWTPLITTPAFPEYTSGHSSLAGAAATVLVDYFGDETPFAVESPVGDMRFFSSFSTAVDEIADARVFAGIHFRAACDDGAAAGSEVAVHILENLMARVHGEGE